MDGHAVGGDELTVTRSRRLVDAEAGRRRGYEDLEAMQEKLRAKILGRRYWEKQENLRLMWGKGRQQNIYELLGDMTTDTAYIIAGPGAGEEVESEFASAKRKKKKKKKGRQKIGKVAPAEQEKSSFAAYLQDSGYKGSTKMDW